MQSAQSAAAPLWSTESPTAVTPHVEPVSVRIARSEQELEQAFGLVYDSYHRAGLVRANPYAMRVTPYQLLETSEVFVGYHRDRLISTVSLIRDGALGLPLEDIYLDDVLRFREAGEQVAEVSCLADCRSIFERTVPALVRVMALLGQTARAHGVDRLLIAIHPRHAAFYERMAGFQKFGELKSYKTVCDRPAVALSLDLNHMAKDHPAAYQRFFGTPFPADELLRPQPRCPQFLERMQQVMKSDLA